MTIETIVAIIVRCKRVMRTHKTGFAQRQHDAAQRELCRRYARW